MGSLSRTLQNATNTAFKVLGDLVKTGTWVRPKPVVAAGGMVAIDFDQGIPAASPSPTEYPLPRVVFVRFKQEEIDHTIVAMNDQKIIFPRQDLPVEPLDSDTYRDFLGRKWEVKRIMSEPSASVVVAQVRAA